MKKLFLLLILLSSCGLTLEKEAKDLTHIKIETIKECEYITFYSDLGGVAILHAENCINHKKKI